VANNLERAYELTLVVRSQIGDEAAFAELLGMYSPRLRFYVSKMLGEQHQSAEDLLQEIWLSAFRGLPKLNDAAAFHAWLFRIARDRVCREFRRKRIDFTPLGAEELESAVAEYEEAVDPEAVHLQLDGLSTAHREALVLRFIEGMSYEEIARVTGHTLGTVRSRIHYAKRVLAARLQKKKL
jgi:RNA polymerase sigma-70 factor (ECF subfamily)